MWIILHIGGIIVDNEVEMNDLAIDNHYQAGEEQAYQQFIPERSRQK